MAEGEKFCSNCGNPAGIPTAPNLQFPENVSVNSNSAGKIGKYLVIGLVLLVALGGLMFIGLKLLKKANTPGTDVSENKKSQKTSESTKSGSAASTLADKNNPKTNKITFPSSNYKKFSSSDNTDSFYPSNIHQYGTPTLKTIQEHDGYVTLKANFMAAKINMPLGWQSFGGFTSFDKLYFFPAGALTVGPLPRTFISLRTMDTSKLGTSDFDTVLRGAEESYKKSESKYPVIKDRILYSDPDNKTFAFEIRKVASATDEKKLQGLVDIYMQNPDPASALWMNMQLSVPDEQFDEYKGLIGLVYKDLEINWSELEQLVNQLKASH
jgi:hypothetical protein